MVLEQMLTILLGTAGGVAAVMYGVKPRQRIETIILPSMPIESLSFASPPVATASPVVVAPVEEFQGISQAPVTALVADAGASEPAAGRVAPSARPVPLVPRSSAPPRPRRALRRSSAAPRTRAISRVPGGVQVPGKSLDGPA